MVNKIYIQDLPCYKNATEKQLHNLKCSPKSCFDLSQLPCGNLQCEAKVFIQERGGRLSITSIIRELFPFNLLCRYINKKEPNLKSFREKNYKELERNLKAWLLENGYRVSYARYKNAYGKDYRQESAVVVYLRKIYTFLEPEDTRSEHEKDVWVLENLGILLRENPIRKIKKISFTAIPQPIMREEIKKAIYMELKNVAVGTVLAELGAVKRFARFLFEHEKQVNSFNAIARKAVENYLTYINTEAIGKKSYRTDLLHLKSIFEQLSKINNNSKMANLLLPTDIPGEVRALYKTYSDEEMIRLNAHIVNLDIQIARALIIHQSLGTRISDTLTLTLDCLYMKGERHMVKIHPVKSHSYEKAIDSEIAMLIQRAIDYTKERYGNVKYIFVCESDTNLPYQYSMLQNKLMVMIRENDIRDDSGELFGIKTHMFRHTYGRKLTEMNLDDYTISKLLGHANTSSVKYYRKLSDSALAEATKELRETMDMILIDLIEEWDDAKL